MRVGRRVFEKASIAYLLVFIGLFFVAFLHDPSAAERGLILSAPLIVMTAMTVVMIFRGLSTRVGVWLLLLLTNSVTTIVTIVMGGLAYHSLPLLFFTFSLAAGFLSIRDAHLATLKMLACLIIIAGATISEDPWSQINAAGVLDARGSYLVAYLGLLAAFGVSAWINSTARLAQELRVVAARERAELAGVEKTGFFALISHEMRTPLNGLLGLSEVLITRSGSGKATMLARKIRSEARDLAQSIDQLLTMIENGAEVGDPAEQSDGYRIRAKRRTAVMMAFAFMTFFLAMLAGPVLFDPARTQVALLASAPFAAMVLATPIMTSLGMSGRVSLRILTWSTLGAAVVICSIMGGLAFPVAHVLLVLPGIAATRGQLRDIIWICLGCFASILIIHAVSGGSSYDIAAPVLTPPGLSWLIIACLTLAAFAYGNWASAAARRKRLMLLKTALRRAESVDEAKAFFLAYVGDRLTTSIRTIQEDCKAFEEEAAPQNDELVKSLGKSAELFADIVASIRRYADPLKPVGPYEVFDPEAMANEVIHDHAEEVGGRRIKLDVISLFGDGGTCFGPRKEVEMILRVLVGNAVKFTAIGAVRITIGPVDPDRISFAVEDTGVGVPDDLVDRIFDGFIQGEKSEVRENGGLGLGLAIARKRARQMAGDVVYAPRTGGGAVFTLTAPLATSPA